MSSRARRTVGVVVVVCAVVAPIFLAEYLVSIGVFGFAAAVGAIGLCLLLGHAGQLSLGHAFFLAVGAYTYIVVAADGSTGRSWGLGLPTAVALVLAVGASAACGAIFCLIAKRLGGISIGLASISLVLIGQHVLNTVPALSGGPGGRPVPPLHVGGLELMSGNQVLSVGGVALGPVQRSWYLILVALVVVVWFARNLIGSRVGRSFQAIRDGSLQAASLGVRPLRVRVLAFAVSSGLAGLSGVLLALAFQYVVPEYWGLGLSLSMLAMLVIGGQTSVLGAVGGAVLVTGLPIFLRELNLDQGSGWLSLSGLPDILYGLGIVLIIYYQPEGLAGIVKRLRVSRGKTGEDPAPVPALDMTASGREPVMETES